MVGDDVENDVLAAQAVGITGVLVRTGKFREDQLARASGTPDLVVGSIVDLPELLGAERPRVEGRRTPALSAPCLSARSALSSSCELHRARSRPTAAQGVHRKG